MSAAPAHLALLAIARHGRASIGNFEEDLQPVVAELISMGLITCALDSGDQSTLWCHLTPAGSDHLFAFNAEVQPAWTLYNWDASEA